MRYSKLDFDPLLLCFLMNTSQECFSGIAMTRRFQRHSRFFLNNSRFLSSCRVGGATGGDYEPAVPAAENFLPKQSPNRSYGEPVMPKPIGSKPTYHIPDPQRLRRINGSFAWIDHRLLRSGFLAVMTSQEQSLYLFLTLAADRNGVSFYRQERIGELLGLDAQAFIVARDRLVELGLLLFEPYSITSPNGFYQLLPTPHAAPDFTAQCVDLEELANVFTPKTKQ